MWDDWAGVSKYGLTVGYTIEEFEMRTERVTEIEIQLYIIRLRRTLQFVIQAPYKLERSCIYCCFL